ncbi:DegT/DnrJ/EryC1/StrS aminotransferase family protein [Alteromonas pelagimontana]|uniref:DegT/DnrJ/EryC1/StrS aminotransferase family protein n=1 Tax=Alteromonas pelagimontana TaxID=1858656 RepID=A0A6M4MG93_9ALTE|nr:DegT/DnrJ/EryC1/StrS family aminotransferase [Alteromonas pelagimontana]QJR81967.1 DegT/DnrJ/EryC1/StrS aminotransferase family protein [Alteromonas pelagimontana]
MSWSQLPPVGTPISIKSQRSAQWLKFQDFNHVLVESGTAALALLLKVIRTNLAAEKTAARNLNVVIPGYACPDLVAACLYANATPVIIDFDASSYQYDLSQLANLQEEVDVILCPSLFGISMPLLPLRHCVPDALIIEDDAQWFPEPENAEDRSRNLVALVDSASAEYVLPEQTRQADFFITSFGRGKPVNLLGGGLAAWHHRYASWFDNIDTLAQSNDNNDNAYRIKARLFNGLCQPLCYGALIRIPGLTLGQTVYHPLDSITKMAGFKTVLVPPSVHAYLSGSMNAQQQLVNATTPAWPEQTVNKRLLRLPVLAANRAARDELLKKLNAAGLGASPMYATPLHDIDGIAALAECPFGTPVSGVIADCLLTLPVHPGVKPRHVRKMIQILDSLRHNIVAYPQV